jgi:MFS family permease
VLTHRLPPVLQVRDYRLLWIAVLTMSVSRQMADVAVGWQVYNIHRNPLDLGLVGLAEFLPLPLLALPAGALADRLPRRLVFGTALVVNLVVTALLLVVTIHGASSLWPFLALAALNGAAGAAGAPAMRALPPELVPVELLASAIAVRSVAAQGAVVFGPAIGGLLFAIQPELVYIVAVVLLGVALVCAIAMSPRAAVAQGEAPGLDSLLGGLRFLRRSPMVLGAIVLDLFAVLFGGAIALLPVFARDYLHTGPVGLGLLRSAPAVGALAAGIMLTRRPVGRHAGRTLLIVVGVFGVSMVVFGLSRWFPLSALALAVSGFVDMISVNIRSMTASLATPDELRGRVMAVEMVFISASNELGAFESGVAAALVGPVPAVVVGGLFTIALALSWTRFFPSLARVDRLEALRPAAAET